MFDGGNITGNFGNISTQAVLELVKNVNVVESDTAAFVEIGTEEIDNFFIDRVGTNVQDPKDHTGELLMFRNKDFANMCLNENSFLVWQELLFCLL